MIGALNSCIRPTSNPFLFLLLLIFFGATVVGQSVNWVNSTNQWTYSAFGFTQIVSEKTIPPHRLSIARDTVIGGLEATILRQATIPGFTQYDFDSFDKIIVRQEGEKFYQYIDSAFRVLYDFSLEVGDTMRGYIPRSLRNKDTTKAYVSFLVDSIGTLDVESRVLKGQHLRYLNFPNDIDGALAAGWRYELIGIINSYLLPYSLWLFFL